MLRKMAGERGFPGRQRMTSDSVGFELQSYEKSGEDIKKEVEVEGPAGREPRCNFCPVA